MEGVKTLSHSLTAFIDQNQDVELLYEVFTQTGVDEIRDIGWIP